jgi:hypothetical protein
MKRDLLNEIKKIYNNSKDINIILIDNRIINIDRKKESGIDFNEFLYRIDRNYNKIKVVKFYQDFIETITDKNFTFFKCY